MSDKNNFEDEFNLEPEESLKLENIVKRLELEMNGANFMEYNPNGLELPPEIEKQMLDSILKFEKLKKKAKEVTIRSLLGKYTPVPLDSLTYEEMIIEKENLLEKLSKKGISVISILAVSDQDMYEFLVNRFLDEKILHIPIKGFVRQFVYEEFNPNESLNVLSVLEFLKKYLFGEADEFITPDVILRDEALKQISTLQEFYTGFNLIDFKLKDVNTQKLKSEVTADIEFEAILDNSMKSHIYQGEIKFVLRKKRNMWCVKNIELPPIVN